MADDIKNSDIFEPETIGDNPMPVRDDTSQETSQKTSNDVYESERLEAEDFPTKRIARQVLSDSINTKARKILVPYKFSQQGAIQIGTFENGSSGDIRISPSGIVARNKDGDQTFALDGDTGDASFKGAVQASDFQLVGGGIFGVVTEGFRSQGGFDNIQEAIDWVHSQGGGIVNLPPGTYNITDDIVLFENITLQGQDADTTIIDFGGDATSVVAHGSFSSNILRNIAIRNIKFQNSTHNTHGAIFLDTVWNSVIEDCVFDTNYDSSAGAGGDIFLNDCERLLITRCRTENSGSFVNATSATPTGEMVVIDNNYISFCELDAIIDPGWNGATVSNNHFEQVTGVSVKIEQQHNKVLNNTFNNCTGVAIQVTADNVTVMGNIIKGSGSSDDHIEITGANQCIINANQCLSIADGIYGIEVGANCAGTIISSNILDGGTGSTGVGVTAGSADETMIHGNHFDVATDTSDIGNNTRTNDNTTL